MTIIREFVIVIILRAIRSGSDAQPFGAPKSMIAQVGTTARFNCTASRGEPVYWTTKPHGSQSTNDIYIGERFLLDEYGASGRFSVEVDVTSRRYDLVIKEISQSDGGVYSCIDERGLGKKLYAELVVWDSLTCQVHHRQDSYMGDNIFGLDQATIGFICRMRYIGNLRPHLIWSAGGRKWNGTQGTDSGIASSSLTIVATSKLDGVVVTCEAVHGGGDSSVDTQSLVLWTSDRIRVRYAILKEEGVKECPGVEYTLKCNPPCSYNLVTVDDKQRCEISYSTNTYANLFYFDPSSAAQISEPVSNNPIFIGVVVAAVCIVSITTTLALGCFTKKLCHRRQIIRSNYAEREPL